MYIIKNAFANLRRNTGRNLLTSIVILIIIFLAAVSIIIHTASSMMIDDYKQRFGSEVSIQNTQNKADEQLTTSMLMSFGESEYLQSKQYLAKTAFVPKDLQALDDDESNAMKGYLFGSSRDDINDEFQKGTRKIVQGTVYKTPQECIISKQFAELNHLKVGDSLTLKSNEIKLPLELRLTISGIYDDVSIHAGTNTYTIAINNRSNEIYASFSTVMASDLFQRYGTLDIKLYLKEPGMLNKLQDELKRKGLPDSYEVTTDEEGYMKIIAPVEHLAKISKSMMMGVLVLGSFLLVLVSIMIMKERTYEIGVLRAIGMKKKHVIYSLLSEILMITGICLLLGLCCAQLAAKPITNVLLSSQPPDTTTEPNSTAPQLMEIDASLHKESILEISIIAFGLALIASAGGILFTIRYEPMKILSERK